MSISINELEEFKKVYVEAKKMKMDSFQYKGAFILVSYAKYLISYMEEL